MFLSVLLLSLTACGTINNALVEKNKQFEYYRIFDIKTDANRNVVANAASKGLGKNVSSANEARPIPTSSTLPEIPGRFQVTEPFKGTAFGALAAQGGGSLGMKMATCEGAVWTANATKNVTNSFNLNLTACLFQYAQGYHLDMYAHFLKQEGGLMQLSRSMANAMVGTPEEWVEKTFLDVVREINTQTNAEISFLEGYPEIQGTPWLDSGESYTKKQ